MDYTELFKKKINSIEDNGIGYHHAWKRDMTMNANKLSTFKTIKLRETFLKTAGDIRDRAASISLKRIISPHNEKDANSYFHEIMRSELIKISMKVEELEQEIPKLLELFKSELEEAETRRKVTFQKRIEADKKS